MDLSIQFYYLPVNGIYIGSLLLISLLYPRAHAFGCRVFQSTRTHIQIYTRASKHVDVDIMVSGVDLYFCFSYQ